MEDPEEDPCGLQHRLEMACEPPLNRATVAATLGISLEILDDILDDPNYVPDPADYEQIVTNLDLFHERQHFRGHMANWDVYFREKPLWTASDVAATVPDYRATSVVLFVCDANYPDRIKSDGPYDLDTFTVQQAIEAATDGDYTRLLTVAYYVPTVEYPYPNS